MPARAFQAQLAEPFVFADGFGIDPEKLAGAANQFTGLGGSEGTATGKNHDGLQETGLTGAVTAKYYVKPGVGQDVYLLKVPQIFNTETLYKQSISDLGSMFSEF